MTEENKLKFAMILAEKITEKEYPTTNRYKFIYRQGVMDGIMKLLSDYTIIPNKTADSKENTKAQ